MSIYVFSDTTGDVPERFLAEHENVGILPLSFSLDEDNYDNIETKLPIGEFYARVKAGAVTRTSMCPTFVMEEMMKAQLDKGNDVLFLSVSSQISGNYEGEKILISTIVLMIMFLLNSSIHYLILVIVLHLNLILLSLYIPPL